MQPKPDLPTTAAAPFVKILDDVVPAGLHKAAWARCAGAGWIFGHGSSTGDGSAFWKLDLDRDAAFDAIWEHVRPRCEQLAGTPLRVRRQYANGHTYGLGGKPHRDDGSFTLLYYPNPEWRDGWDGETVFYDQSGEIACSVRPRPNRLVFFDAGALHAGRAPSRDCPALRVTVAYKLDRCVSAASPQPPQRAMASPVSLPDSASTQHSVSPAAPPQVEQAVVEKLSADGATHVYSIRVPASVVDQAVERRITALSRSVSLPGFRSGNIPAEVLQQRYGSQARTEVLNRLMAEMLNALPKASLPSALELKRGNDRGEVEMLVTATHLPDLPPPDFSKLALKRPLADEATLQSVRESAGIPPERVAAHLRGYLKAQVLDWLDAEYKFFVLPALVEPEFSRVWTAAQSQAEIPADEKPHASIELRAIAERRFRLGWVIAEMARRKEIHSPDGPGLEDKVVDFLAAQVNPEDQPLTPQELLEMMQG